MLHGAIKIGESLGLIGPRAFQTEPMGQMSKDMDTSVKRTAWGLFHIDTYGSHPLFKMTN